MGESHGVFVHAARCLTNGKLSVNASYQYCVNTVNIGSVTSKTRIKAI